MDGRLAGHIGKYTAENPGFLRFQLRPVLLIVFSTGALVHARVEAPGVYVVRGNLLGLGLARGACRMTLCV